MMPHDMMPNSTMPHGMMPHNMMPHDMMNGGISPFWIVVAILLSLALIAAITWLLTRWQSSCSLRQTPPASYTLTSSHTYEQGYQSPEPSPETYQEGGRSYAYPQYEQPVALYPQSMPPQQ